MWAWIAGALLSAANSQATALPDYQIGDIATNDVVAPVRLVVVDAAKTEALRRTEAPQLPPVFQFDAMAFEMANGRLVAAFSRIRERFLEEIKGEFQKKVLAQEELATPAFRGLVSSFQTRHPSFPLTMELAQAWAIGRRASTIQNSWGSRLRQTMNSFIRPENLPPGGWSTAHVMTNDTQFQVVSKRRLITVAQARQNLTTRFPADQQAIARFVGEFVAENCFLHADLTAKTRAERLQTVWEAKQYQPGEVILRAGATVDAQAKAALDELGRVMAKTSVPAHPNHRLFYLSGFLLALCFACLAGCWRFFGRRAGALLPESAPHGAVVRPELDNEEWLERALVAEQRARELAHEARAALVPKFMHWLKSHAVQQLVSQREDLLSTQKLAEMELARLEQMLADIQAPLEERLKTYERRIAELEQALTAKGEESRELIQTMIRLTRSKLERERQEGEGVTWN
jgi:hypothetical protein